MRIQIRQSIRILRIRIATLENNISAEAEFGSTAHMLEMMQWLLTSLIIRIIIAFQKLKWRLFVKWRLVLT